MFHPFLDAKRHTVLPSNFIEDRWEEIETNDAETSIEILVGHNYSELFDSHLSRYIKVSYKGILFQGCFPLPTHSLSYYPFTSINKERFIKQFYWLHSIQFTSSNSLCCSLYPPPPYYTIHIICFEVIGSICSICIEKGHAKTDNVSQRVPSSISKKKKKKGAAKVSFSTAKNIELFSQLRRNDAREQLAHCCNADRLCSKTWFKHDEKVEVKNET